MPKVTTYLPDGVFREWKNDPKRKGLIAKLVSDYYGFEVYKSRTVKKTTTATTGSSRPA